MTSISRVAIPSDAAPKPRFGGIFWRAFGLTNPLMVGLAGKRWNPFFGVVEHTGRKSGRRYSAPIAVRRVDGGFVVTAAFGLQVDWYRNLMAAGGGAIRWQEELYPVRAPVPMGRWSGVTAFALVQRVLLRLTGITNYAFLADAEGASR